MSLGILQFAVKKGTFITWPPCPQHCSGACGGTRGSTWHFTWLRKTRLKSWRDDGNTHECRGAECRVKHGSVHVTSLFYKSLWRPITWNQAHTPQSVRLARPPSPASVVLHRILCPSAVFQNVSSGLILSCRGKPLLHVSLGPCLCQINSRSPSETHLKRRFLRPVELSRLFLISIDSRYALGAPRHLPFCCWPRPYSFLLRLPFRFLLGPMGYWGASGWGPAATHYQLGGLSTAETNVSWFQSLEVQEQSASVVGAARALPAVRFPRRRAGDTLSASLLMRRWSPHEDPTRVARLPPGGTPPATVALGVRISAYQWEGAQTVCSEERVV